MGPLVVCAALVKRFCTIGPHSPDDATISSVFSAIQLT
jgi:hypothetical protein